MRRFTRRAGPGLVLAAAAALAALTISVPAAAQCRVGSGPDMGDGIPYCSDLEPDPPRRADQPPPRQWNDSAAAMAWGDGQNGDEFVGVEHYVDEQMARDMVLAKCHERGLRNCAVAVSVSNAVIAVGIDPARHLSYGLGASKAEALAQLAAHCTRRGLTCKVVRLLDGLPVFE